MSKGFPIGNKYRMGKSPWNKGIKGIHQSEKTEFKKGHKVSEEIKEKWKGRTPWNKGLKVKTNTGKTHFKRGSKINLGRKRPDMVGNKFAWRNGQAYEPYTIDWTKTLRRSIRERDNYICQICSQYGKYVHHIDYKKENCNPNNLITLCHSCHSKTNHNRNYWLRYFKNITTV